MNDCRINPDITSLMTCFTLNFTTDITKLHPKWNIWNYFHTWLLKTYLFTWQNNLFQYSNCIRRIHEMKVTHQRRPKSAIEKRTSADLKAIGKRDRKLKRLKRHKRMLSASWLTNMRTSFGNMPLMKSRWIMSW